MENNECDRENESTVVMEKCFLCWHSSSTSLDPQLYALSDPNRLSRLPGNHKVSSSTVLKKELSVIFLLRTILGIPSDVIAKLLLEQNEESKNPSEWGIKLCRSCHVVFKETEFIYKRLLKFQADFHYLAKQIRELVLTSVKNSEEIKCGDGGGGEVSPDCSVKRGPGRRSKKRKKPGRPPGRRTKDGEKEVEPACVLERLRKKFLEQVSKGSTEIIVPKCLYTTHGTCTILDDVYTIQPIQVRIIQSSVHKKQEKSLITSPKNGHFISTVDSAGESRGGGRKITVVSILDGQDKFQFDNAPPSTDFAPTIKSEIIEDSSEINERDDYEDVGGVPSPDAEWLQENDNICGVEAGEISEHKVIPGEIQPTKRKVRKYCSSGEDDGDSDYCPEPKPKKKDKRFTRKKPNVKENMNRRRMRQLKADSFNKVALTTAVQIVETVRSQNVSIFECPQPECEQKFEKKLDCHAHVLRDHYDDPLPYHCHVCERRRFETERSLRKHMARFHRGAKCPLDEDYNHELHSAEKLKSVVEEDQVWQAHLNKSNVDGRFSDDQSSDDTSVPEITPIPEEILKKFKNEDDAKYQCRHDPCTRRFANEMLRDGHEKRIHLGIEKPFDCPHCKKPFLRRSLLLAHIAVAHYSSGYSCVHCGGRFADKVLLAGHIGRAHLGDNFPFKCSSCPMSFARRTRMDVHMYKKHGIPLPTKVPKRRIPARAIPVPKIDPSKAKKILDGEDLIEASTLKKCWMCHSEDGKPMLFDTPEDLKEHVEEKHSEPGVEMPFRCPAPNCKKEYRTCGYLDFHVVNFHDGQIMEQKKGEFSCAHCDETFHRSYMLDAHMSKHGVSMYMCNFCAKKFRTQRYLDDHQRQAHYKELNIDPLACKYCGKVMNTKKSLDHHIKMIHTKETPFNCSVPGCTFGTMYPSALKIHMNVKHSNRQNAICPICSRTFALQFYLNRHMRVHTGEKPYKCSTCDKEFSDLPTFNRHKEAHLGRIHQCPVKTCGKGYNTRHAFRIHLKQHQRKGDKVEIPNYRHRAPDDDDENKMKIQEKESASNSASLEDDRDPPVLQAFGESEEDKQKGGKDGCSIAHDSCSDSLPPLLEHHHQSTSSFFGSNLDDSCQGQVSQELLAEDNNVSTKLEI